MAKFSLKILIVIGIVVGVSLIPIFLIYVLPHFVPFIIAYLVALMLEPLNLWMAKHTKLNRILAVNINYFIFMGIILLIAYFIITKITTEMIGLIKFIQNNIPNIKIWFLDLKQATEEIIRQFPQETQQQINDQFTSFVNKITSINLIQDITTFTYKITTAIPNFFIIVLIMVISIYLISFNLPKIKEKFFDYFKDSSKKKVQVILKDLRMATVGFIQAQFILSLITYIITLIGLLLMGVDYALAIALLVVIVDILPILGSGSVLVPWAIFSFSQGETFFSIGLIVLFIVIVVVRRAIEPKILGERIGLSPLATLMSIWVGFKVLGILGVFLGPLLLILYNALVKAGILKYKLKI